MVVNIYRIYGEAVDKWCPLDSILGKVMFGKMGDGKSRADDGRR